MRRTILGMIAGLMLGVSFTAGMSVISADGDGSGDSVASFLPDMEQVFNNALVSMFDSAGQKFTDPELKDYYDRLTQSIVEREPYEPEFDPSITLNDGTVVQ